MQKNDANDCGHDSKKIQTPILDGKLKIFFNDLVFLIFDAKVCIIFG